MNNQKQKKKIIIIDDEVSFLSIFSKALENAGFEVRGFSDPKEAIKLIPAERADLILLDITMPEIDGFVVFEQLKNYLGSKMPKTVFLTNLGETVSGASIDEYFAKNIGAEGYVKKTDDLSAIVQKIKQLI